jgi:hypothetical protein
LQPRLDPVNFAQRVLKLLLQRLVPMLGRAHTGRQRITLLPMHGADLAKLRSQRFIARKCASELFGGAVSSTSGSLQALLKLLATALACSDAGVKVDRSSRAPLTLEPQKLLQLVAFLRVTATRAIELRTCSRITCSKLRL